MNSRVNSSLTNGFIWLFCSTLGQYFLQFASMVILARLLTPTQFGVVGLAMVVINLLKLFSQLGVGPALVYLDDLSNLHTSTAQVISIFISIVLFFITYISAPYIELFFGVSDLVGPIRCLALLLPLSAPSIIYINLMQRFYKFKLMSISNFISYGIGGLAVSVPLAYEGAGIWALVFGYIAQSFSLTIILIIIERKNLIGMRFDKVCASQLLNYGIGFSMGRLANFFAGQGDNLVVGKVLDASSLGLYGRAYQLMSMPALLVGQAMDKVLFPAMSRRQSSVGVLSSMYWDALGIVGIISIPLSALLNVTAKDFIYIIFGSGWDGAILPFQILSIILVFRMAYRIPDSLSRAVGTVYKRAWRQLVYALLVIVLSSFGGYMDGLKGVSIGVAASVIINFLLMHHLSLQSIDSRKSSMNLFLKWSILYCVCYTFSYMLSYAIRDLSLSSYGNIVIHMIGVGISILLVIISTGRLFSKEKEYFMSKSKKLIKFKGV